MGVPSFAIETHLLDFQPIELDANTPVTVEFLERLRDEIRFPTVDALREQMNDVFGFIEEAAADAMDQMTFRAVTELHAAVIYYLVQTARPLPRMLSYAFADVLPSLVLAYRLYADAGRADELRAENKIIHPAFSLREGLALSG